MSNKLFGDISKSVGKLAKDVRGKITDGVQDLQKMLDLQKELREKEIKLNQREQQLNIRELRLKNLETLGVGTGVNQTNESDLNNNLQNNIEPNTESNNEENIENTENTENSIEIVDNQANFESEQIEFNNKKNLLDELEIDVNNRIKKYEEDVKEFEQTKNKFEQDKNEFELKLKEYEVYKANILNAQSEFETKQHEFEIKQNELHEQLSTKDIEINRLKRRCELLNSLNLTTLSDSSVSFDSNESGTSEFSRRNIFSGMSRFQTQNRPAYDPRSDPNYMAKKQSEFRELIKTHLYNKFVREINGPSRNQFVNNAISMFSMNKNDFKEQNKTSHVIANIHNVFRFDFRNGRNYPTNNFEDLLQLYPDDDALYNCVVRICKS